MPWCTRYAWAYSTYQGVLYMPGRNRHALAYSACQAHIAYTGYLAKSRPSLPIHFFLFNLHWGIPNDHPVSALESSLTALTAQIFRDWSVISQGSLWLLQSSLLATARPWEAMVSAKVSVSVSVSAETQNWSFGRSLAENTENFLIFIKHDLMAKVSCFF